jgi:hypothetical protein
MIITSVVDTQPFYNVRKGHLDPMPNSIIPTFWKFKHSGHINIWEGSNTDAISLTFKFRTVFSFSAHTISLTACIFSEGKLKIQWPYSLTAPRKCIKNISLYEFRFSVSTMKITILCDVMPCGFMDSYKCFKTTSCSHLHSRRWRQKVPPEILVTSYYSRWHHLKRTAILILWSVNGSMWQWHEALIPHFRNFCS